MDYKRRLVKPSRELFLVHARDEFFAEVGKQGDLIQGLVVGERDVGARCVVVVVAGDSLEGFVHVAADCIGVNIGVEVNARVTEGQYNSGG